MPFSSHSLGQCTFPCCLHYRCSGCADWELAVCPFYQILIPSSQESFLQAHWKFTLQNILPDPTNFLASLLTSLIFVIFFFCQLTFFSNSVKVSAFCYSVLRVTAVQTRPFLCCQQQSLEKGEKLSTCLLRKILLCLFQRTTLFLSMLDFFFPLKILLWLLDSVSFRIL